MNKVILIGNLTKDPEFATTTNGVAVVRFTLAVSRKFTNDKGEREADFINCVAWRGLAENVDKYVSKGDKVAVCGTLQTRTYEAQDGSKRYATEVIADEVEFIGGKKNDGERGAKFPTTPIDGGDFPF